MVKWVCRGLAAALVVTAMSLLVSTPTQASGWRPDPGAHFNVPRTRDAQWRLERRVVAAIKHARKGSYIKISLFSFDRKPVARDLVRAKRRGVHVQVLTNDHQFTAANRILRNGLGTNRQHRSWARQCTHGCRSHGDILHTKFFLFGTTGVARHVVMVGSLNLTYNAVHNQYNDMWVSNGKKQTFNWFNDLFKQLAKDKPAGEQNPPHAPNENWSSAGGSTIVRRLQNAPGHGSLLLQAIPWPRYSAKNDPIMYLLDRVHCYGATGGTGGSGHRTIVRVSMHAWSGDRGAWLARKFRSLYADGCHVELMYGFAGAKVRNVLAKRTKRGYVPVRSNGYDTNGDGDLDLYSHQKELMISGHYGKQHKYRLSVTGSSNYANHGLTGDEILFLIHRHAAYNAYTANFKYVWKNHTHPVHYQPRSARMSTNLQLAPRSLVQQGGDRLPDGTVLAPQPRPAGPAWEGD